MESHREDINSCENTEMAIQLVGSSDQEGFQNQQGSSATVEWSEEFQCLVVNGILEPVPLSAVPMETAAVDEQESAANQVESSKRGRKTEGDEKFFCRLFKFPKDGEHYLLEWHEDKPGGDIDQYHVFVYESTGRWKVEVCDLERGNHEVIPMLQDPTPPVFHKKYALSLGERLTGWSMEKRKRGDGKKETIYYHPKRQFRSFVEVTTFIIYSNIQKGLQS